MSRSFSLVLLLKKTSAFAATLTLIRRRIRSEIGAHIDSVTLCLDQKVLFFPFPATQLAMEPPDLNPRSETRIAKHGDRFDPCAIPHLETLAG